MEKVIVIFTKYPKPGKVKTRLIPYLGPQTAALLHRRLTEHVVGCAREAARAWNLELQVHFQGGHEQRMREWLGEGIMYQAQEGGDLGERMQRAFGNAFQRGACSVVLVGSDLPGLTSMILGEAFGALETHRVVLGPAMDGGYYLIGMKKDTPDLFSGIPWGSEYVFLRTLERIAQLGLGVKLLKKLHDVDRPEDLPSAAFFVP